MIIGIGIDILEKYRIKKIIQKYEVRFIKKILSDAELKIYKNTNNKIEFLSKIFAVKESFVKALGTGFTHGLSFNKITIYNNQLGKPFIKKNKNIKILITLSHEKNITIAMTIIKTSFKLN